MRGRQLITYVCVERDERRRSRSVCSLVSTASSQPRWYPPSSYPHHAGRCVEWTEGRADGTSPQPVRIPTESPDERRAWERLCSQHVGKAFSRVEGTGRGPLLLLDPSPCLFEQIGISGGGNRPNPRLWLWSDASLSPEELLMIDQRKCLTRSLVGGYGFRALRLVLVD